MSHSGIHMNLSTTRDDMPTGPANDATEVVASETELAPLAWSLDTVPADQLEVGELKPVLIHQSEHRPWSDVYPAVIGAAVVAAATLTTAVALMPAHHRGPHQPVAPTPTTIVEPTVQAAPPSTVVETAPPVTVTEAPTTPQYSDGDGAPAEPAPPMPLTQDQQFISQLTANGVTMESAAGAVKAAHTVCQLHDDGEPTHVIVRKVQVWNPGITRPGAESMVSAAIATYCPV